MSADEMGRVVEGKVAFVFFYYEPSLPAAASFIIIFAILTALHIWRIIQHRSYYFISLTIGGCCTYPLGPPSYLLRICSGRLQSRLTFLVSS